MNYHHRFFQSIVFIAALLLLTLPVTVFAAQTVSVKKNNVNVRTGPGKKFQVSMVLPQDYPLKVIETKGNWLKITDFENDTGWIYSSLVKPGSTVIANGKKTVNMRSKPSTSATVIAEVHRAAILTKLATKGKWVKVQHSRGTIGWIYSPLLWP